MGEILQAFPGARRALFARYHIGGCSSCAYSEDETLAEVCERNEELPVEEVVNHILLAHEDDAKTLIEPTDLKALIEGDTPPRLLDLRTREEHEAVALENSQLYSNELLQEIYAQEPKDRVIVVYDHTGDRSLDVAAYLRGHEYKNTKALRGGIDAYAQEADEKMPRYKLEFED